MVRRGKVVLGGVGRGARFGLSMALQGLDQGRVWRGRVVQGRDWHGWERGLDGLVRQRKAWPGARFGRARHVRVGQRTARFGFARFGAAWSLVRRGSARRGTAGLGAVRLRTAWHGAGLGVDGSGGARRGGEHG